MTASRNANGYAITSRNYFSELGELLKKNFDSASRSSICEARKKLHWGAFEYLLHQSRLEDQGSCYQWKGHNVRAIDGTKLTLPHSNEIIKEFPQRRDGRSGILSHYPFSILVTASDVFTGQPLAARMANMHGSERGEAISMIQNDFAPGDIVLLDRGLDGIRVWRALDEQKQFYISRLKEVGKSGHLHLQYVHEFIVSGKKDKIIKRKTKDPITSKWVIFRIRLIRGRKLKDGSVLVVGTNLYCPKKYPPQDILQLYAKRWNVETMYARVKTLFSIEEFHAKSPNGILQEVFSNLLVLSLTAKMAVQAASMHGTNITKVAPNFKNAAEVLRRNLFYRLGVAPLGPRNRLKKAKQIIAEIMSVLCKKQPGRSYPRYSRKPVNRWPYAKASKIEMHAHGRRSNESKWARVKHDKLP